MSNAPPVTSYYAIMKDPAVQQKEDELKAQKIKRVAICLIALGITLLAATAIIGYKFHIYHPFIENSYHYLGLAIIGLGGISIGSFLIYKGIMAPKEAKIKEFEAYINSADNRDGSLVNRIIEAHYKNPSLFTEGFITVDYLNKLLGEIIFDEQAKADHEARELANSFYVGVDVNAVKCQNPTVYKLKITHRFLNPNIPQSSQAPSDKLKNTNNQNKRN